MDKTHHQRITTKQTYIGVYYKMLNAMENYFSELKSVIDNLDRNEIETFIK